MSRKKANNNPPSAPRKSETVYPGEYSVSQNGRGIGDDGTLAPWPSIDKYPTIIGSNLTLAYLSSVYRNAQTGYRQQYVDVLDELLERDPHAFAVVSQRIIGVASGRMTMIPADCDDSEKDRAKEIAEDCEKTLRGIEQFDQALSGLLWGVFYGVSAAEINWNFSNDKWSPVSLSWIHSRRLAYPDPNSWAVKIWDLGMLMGWGTSQGIKSSETMTGFGISPSDFPGKFIVHAPQLRGNYPTRDGIGREIAYWMALKLMSARNLSAFVERFGKPWPIGYYNSTTEGKDHPRAATNEDKEVLQATLQNLGAGNLNAAALPDSVHVDLGGPLASRLPPELPQTQLIRVCNGEISKAVLGQSDTTEAGGNGSRSAAEVRKSGTIEIYRFDAACLCGTLKRDLVSVLVQMNYPGEEHLTPTPHIDVEPPPDRKEESEIIKNMVTAGAPIDADRAAQITGTYLVPNPTKEPRRLFLCKGTENPSFFDDEPVLPPGTPDLTNTVDPETGVSADAEHAANAAKYAAKTAMANQPKNPAKPGVKKPATATKKPKGNL